MWRFIESNAVSGGVRFPFDLAWAILTAGIAEMANQPATLGTMLINT
jgi:hypothetical protein